MYVMLTASLVIAHLNNGHIFCLLLLIIWNEKALYYSNNIYTFSQFSTLWIQQKYLPCYIAYPLK